MQVSVAPPCPLATRLNNDADGSASQGLIAWKDSKIVPAPHTPEKAFPARR
jgi:hypothetical protein